MINRLENKRSNKSPPFLVYHNSFYFSFLSFLSNITIHKSLSFKYLISSSSQKTSLIIVSTFLSLSPFIVPGAALHHTRALTRAHVLTPERWQSLWAMHFPRIVVPHRKHQYHEDRDTDSCTDNYPGGCSLGWFRHNCEYNELERNSIKKSREGFVIA